jgi:hypothetical protein
MSVRMQQSLADHRAVSPAPSRGNALMLTLVAVLIVAIGVLAYLVLTK